MESTFDWQKVNLPEIVDGLTAIIFTPVIVPVAEIIKQPVVKTAIQEGVTLSQRYQEVVADTVEAFEHVGAAARGERTLQTTERFNYRNTQISQPYLTDGKSAVTKDLLNIMSDFNADVYKMTNGAADLRLIVPLGLSLLALTQLIKQGFKFEDIPWYILAWFAFDSFIKLNVTEESQRVNTEKN
ncbi:DUF5132 domain-containing protein [Fortiea sp. LEGE XX443]|uniref:DUF5132 domain-containing protein n=1 Tax=Fortiea sp. LEGE XX443 TaxID=1828611 RepID=UPI00188137CD|nr:DUF5132 domain-containing protein [Fortiea sp. LEGE XX443]MBE9005753.1 DUF5132 domain-containing protein [Fortiea sp. LEGE XX443]